MTNEEQIKLVIIKRVSNPYVHMFSEKGIIHFNFEFIIEIDTHETGLVLHQTAL